MRDADFEWDDEKAAANIAKHGISFEMARDAFDDPFIVEWLDETQAADEPRFAALGMVQQRILFIAYTMRGDAIRIISARRALPSERRKYANDNEA